METPTILENNVNTYKVDDFIDFSTNPPNALYDSIRIAYF